MAHCALPPCYTLSPASISLIGRLFWQLIKLVHTGQAVSHILLVVTLTSPAALALTRRASSLIISNFATLLQTRHSSHLTNWLPDSWYQIKFHSEHNLHPLAKKAVSNSNFVLIFFGHHVWHSPLHLPASNI